MGLKVNISRFTDGKKRKKSETELGWSILELSMVSCVMTPNWKVPKNSKTIKSQIEFYLTMKINWIFFDNNSKSSVIIFYMLS